VSTKRRLIVAVIVIVPFLVGGVLEDPAYAVPPLTLKVAPTTVANGSVVVATGTAPCAYVVITAHAGALGVSSVGPLKAPVEEGSYTARIQLPTFAPDPSRPGLDAHQNFEATCFATAAPVATATVTVTGIVLPTTGAATQPLILCASTLGLAGAALMVAARRRIPRYL
jgi:hypothetical protein